MVSASADVAIVGGGLVGCFAAYFLRARGRSVIILEKGAAAAAASGSNFGNLRLQGRHPAQFPLSLRAQAIWEDLARLSGEACGLVACGHLYLGLAASDQPKLATAAGAALAAGLDVELLTGAAARHRWPMLSSLVTGASWSKRDAVAEPGRVAPIVARLAVRAGAELIEHTKVVRIERAAGGFAIGTDGGANIRSDYLINAAGAWGGEIAAAYGEPVPLFAAGPPLFALRPEHPWEGPSLHAIDGTVLLRQGEGGAAVAGAFPRVAADLASGVARVPSDRLARGLERLGAVLPGLGRLLPGRVWSGVEGYLPDMLPIIGWSGSTPGLVHAFGFSGHGFQLAPGVGAVLAELIATGVTETPIEAFSLARFGGEVAFDDKLWHEFDAELVARFRKQAAPDVEAGGRSP
ncbi:MAG TPA: FAD-dependent oxidoreductase [Hyphomicrobiaceae bacterium]|nr:FAD-dependent oxidoreductase [Hyphomicrobiaceae bacterium]